MKKTIAVMVALCLAAGVVAQEKPARVQKVLSVKYADPQRLANLLTVFDVSIKIDSAMKIIAVQGTPESVAALEEALKKLDVPSPSEKNIELVFHILYASPKPDGDKLPAELEEVTKRLKSVFSYQGFYLLETVVSRTRDGRGSETSGVASDRLNRGGVTQSPTYQLRIQATHLATGDKAPMVRIDGLRFNLRMPVVTGKDKEGNPTWQFREAGLNTDLDVREGQKIVVGKAAMDGSDSAIVLVVTAKVVD